MMSCKNLKKQVPKGKKDYVFGDSFRRKVKPIKK